MIAEMESWGGTPVNTDVAHLGAGVRNASTPRGGQLTKQGVVACRDQTGRFDDVVGRGWSVIGLNTDPRLALESSHLATLEATGASVVSADSSTVDVVDTEGAYTRWLEGENVTYVITRPDFYTYATAADGTELRELVDSLTGFLHLTHALALSK